MVDDFKVKPITPAAQAVSDFVDWLYEEGPDPASMPRGKLLYQYATHLQAQHERGKGVLVQFPTPEPDSAEERATFLTGILLSFKPKETEGPDGQSG